MAPRSSAVLRSSRKSPADLSTRRSVAVLARAIPLIRHGGEDFLLVIRQDGEMTLALEEV
jgi:hypothetical protein